MSKFVLKVDPVKVDRDFKMIERSRDRLTSFDPMVTKLEDLGFSDFRSNNTPFLEMKEPKVVMFTHLNTYTEKEKMPEQTSYCCFHCTEPFTGRPLGIPMEFIPSHVLTVSRQYQEDIGTKSISYIHGQKEKERVLKKLQEQKTEGVEAKFVEREYFEVDGNFCSFPCMISYYAKNRSKTEYKNSKALLDRMHFILYKTPLVWRHAPDIRLLTKFGGHLTIEEFRSEEGSKYTENFGFNRIKPEHVSQQYPLVPITKLFNYNGTKY